MSSLLRAVPRAPSPGVPASPTRGPPHPARWARVSSGVGGPHCVNKHNSSSVQVQGRDIGRGRVQRRRSLRVTPSQSCATVVGTSCVGSPLPERELSQRLPRACSPHLVLWQVIMAWLVSGIFPSSLLKPQVQNHLVFEENVTSFWLRGLCVGLHGTTLQWTRDAELRAT